MKTIIAGFLITIIVLSMFGFFYKNNNQDNKEMQNYQMNSPWTMNNTSLHHNYNMMNNNFKMNRGIDHNSMNYRHYRM